MLSVPLVNPFSYQAIAKPIELKKLAISISHKFPWVYHWCAVALFEKLVFTFIERTYKILLTIISFADCWWIFILFLMASAPITVFATITSFFSEKSIGFGKNVVTWIMAVLERQNS